MNLLEIIGTGNEILRHDMHFHFHNMSYQNNHAACVILGIQFKLK